MNDKELVEAARISSQLNYASKEEVEPLHQQ